MWLMQPVGHEVQETRGRDSDLQGECVEQEAKSIAPNGRVGRGQRSKQDRPIEPQQKRVHAGTCLLTVEAVKHSAQCCGHRLC